MKQDKNHSSRIVSRRSVLKGGAAAVSSFMLVPRQVLGKSESAAPSERLNVAVIGTGGRGTQHMKELLRQEDVRVPAICDVTKEADYGRFYYGGVAGRGPAEEIVNMYYADNEETKHYGKCGVYLDFRKMFDKEKEIDAVVVATPDHGHAITSIGAIERGKHVYCEKPLAPTVYESRKITEAARKMGVATQLGNQGHSGEGIRQTVEWIRDGAIGEIREVHAWHNGGSRIGLRKDYPKDKPPVPEGMDWDLWLGPAKKRPYHPDYAPYVWRGWWDFGPGALGDFGCHNMDPAFWALDLKHPTTVEGRAFGLSPVTTPLACLIYYEFPKRGNLPPVKLTWYSGLMPPRPDELEPGEDLVGDGNGILFVGESGKIMCPGWAGPPTLLPKSKHESYKRPPETLKRSKGHMRDWLDACKGGDTPSADFEYGGLLSEVVMLGNVAIRAQEKLSWDGKNMKAANCPKADQYIRPEYHNGWEI